MPIYEYRCHNGHEFEVFQSMSDDPVEVCETCGAPVDRVFSPVAVHYKGSGFYTTDYAKKGSSKASSGDDSALRSRLGSRPTRLEVGLEVVDSGQRQLVELEQLRLSAFAAPAAPGWVERSVSRPRPASR